MKKYLSLSVAIVTACAIASGVWAMSMFTQTALCYAVYLVTFPIVRLLGRFCGIEGWGLLAAMIAYAVTVAVIAVYNARILKALVLVHCAFAVYVLVIEWPAWLP
jgi:hypothetical protein